MSNDICAAPGKSDFTFGSLLDVMISNMFVRVESLDPNALHRRYTECKICKGTDNKRRVGQRPSYNLVEHGVSCDLAHHLPRLKAMANKDVT